MNIHILGIAGTISAPLAIELQNQGHTVTGSDQDHIYPPISTLIKKHHISFNTTPVTSKIDLAIIGASFQKFARTRQEFTSIKKLKIPYISTTKYLAKNLAKKNSILVAGAWGKTTITALLVHILQSAGLNPSYMFGGQTIKNSPSLEITSSDISVLEADESVNGLDTRAKFLYYPVTHAIITSTSWEHKDSYSTPAASLTAYRSLIQKIPPHGSLIYNPQDAHLTRLAKHCLAPALPYSNQKFSTPLLGAHNQQNIAATFTLCQRLNIPTPTIKQAIASFTGIKRRLQIIKQTSRNIIIDDVAQSPPRIQTALLAVQKAFPKKIIKVFFEPQAGFLAHLPSLSGLKPAFKPAQEIVLAKIKYHVSTSKRVTLADYQKQIGSKLIYLPLYSQIKKHYLTTLKPNQILIHFSSGGLPGLQTLARIAKNLK